MHCRPSHCTYNTDVAAGARLQYNSFHARDNFDPTAPVGPLGANPQGLPLDASETDHALHIGVEHRFNPVFAVFARAAHSFRLPNIDERVGMAPVLTVTNFNLRHADNPTTTKPASACVGTGSSLQSSAYNMYLTDELHFSPITFSTTPISIPRIATGWRTLRSTQLTENVLLEATLSYTRAVFRWAVRRQRCAGGGALGAGAAGVSWNIYQKYLVFDGVLRFVGQRFMDGDEANAGALMVPAHTVGRSASRRRGWSGFFWGAIGAERVQPASISTTAFDTSFPGESVLLGLFATGPHGPAAGLSERNSNEAGAQSVTAAAIRPARARSRSRS